MPPSGYRWMLVAHYCHKDPVPCTTCKKDMPQDSRCLVWTEPNYVGYWEYFCSATCAEEFESERFQTEAAKASRTPPA